MRVANEQLVAAQLLSEGAMPVGALVSATGLSVPTVHRALGHLSDLGLVQGLRVTGARGRGRPAAAFRLSHTAKVAVADVGNETTRYGIVDESGQMHAERRVPTEELAHDLLGSLAALVQGAASIRSSGGPLVGAVVGLPAAVDPVGGEIVGAPIYRQWVGLDVRAGLRVALGCPVEAFQDDHLAAWGERANWADFVTGTVVAVNIGKGIGIGWASDQGPVRGDRGRAGRVADWPEPSVGDGDMVLADVLTADGLVAAYRNGGGGAGADRALSGSALAELALNGDGVARAVFDTASIVLGHLLLRVGTLLDPSLIVVRGGLAGARELLEPGVARSVGSSAGEGGRLPWTWTRLGDRSVLAGASRMATGLFHRWLDAVIADGVAAPNSRSAVAE
jgi:glucokinase